MPFQNRVTPHGDIIADPARGMFMGNRGCLHNDRSQIIWPFKGKRWIICLLAFKGRSQTIMAPGKYTHLFFLDEATALAAGHRPCAECRRSDFNAFRQAWATANPELAGGEKPPVVTIDAVLHRERIDTAKKKVVYATTLVELTDGVFVILNSGERPHLVWRDRLLPWTTAGYGTPISPPFDASVTVLTPRSTVGAIAEGYRPIVHVTAV